MQKEKTKKIKLARKVALLGAVVLVGVCLFFAIKLQKSTPTVRINNAEVHVEIATTSQERQRGLCCRESLSEDAGMLFIYGESGDYSFWMKDTLIPLDMVWISSEKKIVHIEEGVQPSSYPASFSSPVPAQYILETNAGWTAKHGVKIGNEVNF